MLTIRLSRPDKISLRRLLLFSYLSKHFIDMRCDYSNQNVIFFKVRRKIRRLKLMIKRMKKVREAKVNLLREEKKDYCISSAKLLLLQQIFKQSMCKI